MNTDAADSSSGATEDSATDPDPCGDGVCAADENSDTCLEDCPVSPLGCGIGRQHSQELESLVRLWSLELARRQAHDGRKNR